MNQKEIHFPRTTVAYRACSCLRDSAGAVPSAWKALPPISKWAAPSLPSAAVQTLLYYQPSLTTPDIHPSGTCLQYCLYSSYHCPICLLSYLFICLPHLNGLSRRAGILFCPLLEPSTLCLIHNRGSVNICQMSTFDIALEDLYSLAPPIFLASLPTSPSHKPYIVSSFPKHTTPYPMPFFLLPSLTNALLDPVTL